jgi:hypothetical protein
MSDEVRDPRSFEPPPWEADQFEELRRRREAEQAVRERAERLAAEAGVQPAERGTESETETEDAGKPPERVSRKTPRTVDEGPDPAEVDMMMMGLAAEEPDVAQPFRVVGFVIAAIVALVGAATTIAGIWGLVAQAGRGGVMGSLAAWVVIAFGLLLVAGGGWLTVLSMKQRGA